MVYDFIIIGAGIAGSMVAHYLKGFKTLILEQEGIASGGSGSAGAFISPRIGKSSPILTLTNEAYCFALNLYNEQLPKEFITQKGVLRVEDEEALKAYLPHTTLPYEIKEEPEYGLFFADGAIVEPKALCSFFIDETKLAIHQAKKIEQKEGIWIVDRAFRAKHIILTNGAYQSLIDTPYMQIKPIYGHRYDVVSSTTRSFNYHKNFSISATKSDGTIAIGATNHLPNSFPPNSCPLDTSDMLPKALEHLKTMRIVRRFYAPRASSYDFFPILGELIEEKATLKAYPYLTKGSKVPPKLFLRHKNLFVLNGLGARGFVFAPLLAKLLVEHILEQKALQKEIAIERLFIKFARREGDRFLESLK